MDCIGQGDDVRETVPGWFLYADNLFQPKLTLEQAFALWRSDPKRFRVSVNHYADGPSARVDEFLGHRQRNFADVENEMFDCYAVCPECGAFFNAVGVIERWVFVGVKDPSLPR